MYRVTNLEATAGLEAGNDLPIEAGCVEGQSQLLWDVQQLQFHLGADLLLDKQMDIQKLGSH